MHDKENYIQVKFDDKLFHEIGTIHLDKQPSKDPDADTLGTEKSLSEEQHKLTVRRAQIELDNLNNASQLSTTLAKWILGSVLVWIIMLCGFLVYQSRLLPDMRLSNSVLITLLSTTTVDILGLLWLVVKYVFHYRLKI